MEWSVENNLVCPTTGTAFALTSGAENLKFILWYKGDYFLRTGSVISRRIQASWRTGKKETSKSCTFSPTAMRYGPLFITELIAREMALLPSITVRDSSGAYSRFVRMARGLSPDKIIYGVTILASQNVVVTCKLGIHPFYCCHLRRAGFVSPEHRVP